MLHTCNGAYFEIKDTEAQCEFFSNANELTFVGPAGDEQHKKCTGDGLIMDVKNNRINIPTQGNVR